MKNFFTSLLGSLVALIVFFGGCFLLFVGLVATVASMGGKKDYSTAEFERGSYLVVDLSTNITDAPPPIDLGVLGGGDETLQLRNVTHALRAAAKDDRIAGVYISGDLSSAAFGAGYAQLREVRNALLEVKAAGKPVVAYLTYATTRSYYLASAASELVIDPYGVILMPGLATEPMFYAGAFEKYGVNVQVTRVGKYKSAVEPFIRRDMSPENREEIQSLLNDIWGGVLADIAPSRGVKVAQLQATVDREGIIRAETAKANRLVDRVAYRDEIFDDLKEKTGRGADSKRAFKQVALSDYAKSAKDIVDTVGADGTSGSGDRIAIVYAEGEIVDGEGRNGEIGATEFSRELRRLRRDPSVKAVVLRVNSPGGSASASEVIQREVRLIKQVKPIVVSMGSYAASGGYWISTYGDRIFAEPTTITGSIGVFGIQFDVQKLAGDFGVTFDRVKTGKYADAMTIARPKTPEELAIVQRMVDWIYAQFVGKVAESRKLPRARVEEIAQGRVWSGTAAKELGLVDEIGGLDAAIAYAAKKAKIQDSYRLVEFPREKPLMEALQEMLAGRHPNRADASTLAGKVVHRLESELKVLQSLNDPQGVYARMPLNLTVN
ncbi:signal peptide peptidase SppA [Opitutus sp. ER46]|uniref:signal peptide peptidase SppA n=1 Tax=Opitutus sp. ER46 TaxID=2161864 RepID=UPI000D31C993|nr:signal peptide peptidase SppA [Opitutus sp. ER46]PTX94540.1 signal peptide peptidase SppA [Opitutus sp. ER46]